jgi:chromosome segregation ATPase
MADAFAEAAARAAGPTTKEINQAIQLTAVGELLKSTEADLRSSQDRVKALNDRTLKLETENVRLKMQRTDAELGKQVDGLRIEVGKKDRELLELRKRITMLQENEAIILRRAAVAEQKIVVMQNTIETMQRGRDSAFEQTEKHDRERLDAVRSMIDAQDRAKRAEARVAELEKRNTKPIAKDDNALRFKKK